MGSRNQQREKIDKHNPFDRKITVSRLAQDLIEGGPRPSGLVVTPDGAIQAGKFTLTPVGLEMSPGATFEEWVQIGESLKRIHRSYIWLVIDWLIHGEREWGDTYRQVAEHLGYKVETLHNYVSVGKRIEISRRREELSIGHHDAVASLSPQKQAEWLGAAVTNSWNRETLRNAILGITPPTLSDGKDPISKFERIFLPFQQRIHRVLRKAGQGDRRKIANWLRQEADKIERGDE